MTVVVERLPAGARIIYTGKERGGFGLVWFGRVEQWVAALPVDFADYMYMYIKVRPSRACRRMTNDSKAA